MRGTTRNRPQRPYVGDSGRTLTGPADAVTVGIGFVALALATGFIIGLLVFAVMDLSIWLTSLLWDGVGTAMGVAWFPLVACPLGGLAIGLWTWFSQNRVASLETVMREFRETGRYDLHGPGKSLVSFLLPLVFGGSVGFEAGLTGFITAGCCWVRDKLKEAGLREAAIAEVTMAASFTAIFGAPLAGIVAGAETAPADDGNVSRSRAVDAYDMRRGVKLVLYLAAAIGAFGGISVFSSLFGGSLGLPRFDAIQVEGIDLFWVLPCLLAAYALTLVHHLSDHVFAGLALRMGDDARATVMKPVIAGMLMGTVAVFFPLVLFPGEAQSHELMQSWQSWTVLALIGTAVFKAMITPLCLRMGWMGGAFFPSIFSGVACGYGLAMLTGADPMLMVTVVTSAYLAGVTRKPLLSVAILALCFPLTGLLWSGLAAVVGGSLPVPQAWMEEEE